MKTIWKYQIDLMAQSGAVAFDLPKNAKVVHVDSQAQNTLQFWIEINPTQDPEKRTFRVFGTGHPIHLDWPTVICVCEILTTIFHCAHHCCNGSTKQTTATKECPEFQKNQSQHTQTSKQNGTPHTSYLFNQLLNFSEDQMATSLPKSSPRSASTLQ